MKKFWKKKIKDTNILAEKLGVNEEKIKELKEGKRQIEGDTLDKVLKAIEDEKINEPIANMEILQWYRDTDITALRKKFGYKSQKAFADAIGYDVSVVCRMENKKLENKNKDLKFKSGVPASLKKVYYFFKDDFNKNIESEKEEKMKIFKWYKATDIRSLRGNMGLKEKSKEIGLPMTSLNDVEHKRPSRITENIIKVYNYYMNNASQNNDTDINNYSVNVDKKTEKEIWKWYKKTNILQLRKKLGMSQQELSKLIAISQPCIGEVERKATKSVSPTMIKLYKFYNDADSVENVIDTTTNEDDEIMNWYKSIEDFGEYRRKFGYSKNKFMAVLNLSNDQTREFERHNYKSVTPVVKKIYEFYHNEENRLPEIEWTPNDNNTWVSGNMTIIPNNEELQAILIPQNDNKHFIDEIAKLKEENEQLRQQVARYEKLIDRL